MKYLTGASAGILLAFGVAQTAGAADLPVEIPVVEPVAAAPLWSGFYVGGQLGYAFGADVVGRNPDFNDLDRRLNDRRDPTECIDTDVSGKEEKFVDYLENVDVDDGNISIGDDGEIIFQSPIVVGDFAIFADEIDEECVADFLSDRDDARAVLGPYGVEKNDDESWEGGIYVGADAQFGNFVFGVIGDFNLIDLEGDVLVRNAGGAEVFHATAELDWYATLRARAGIAFDRFLAYAHGGLAYSRVEVEGTGRNIGSISGDTICFEEDPRIIVDVASMGYEPPMPPPPRLVCYDDVDEVLQPVSFDDDEDLWGYAIGVGAEALLRENVSAKVEYQYTNLGEETFGGLFDETESAEIEVDFHTVRLGVAFRF